ncbi:MAG: hypothetical protein KAT29_04750 [Anaerolineales bacterium]|nr:hypothetical protein [Anaerolineales bacterium]
MNSSGHNSFSSDDIQALSVPMKIGILGTVNGEGVPHLTMLSTLQASSSQILTFGQFTEGLSKHHVVDNPKTSFLIMTLNKLFWRGKADWSHKEKAGPEYDMYNDIPMFRYNAYFGVHTVHYLNLVEQSGCEQLPMGRVVWASIHTLIAKAIQKKSPAAEVLNSWTRALFSKLDNLKFVCYIGDDGYPVIFPVIQAQPLDAERIVFSFGAFGEDLRKIPVGAPLAIFGLTLDMEDVLLRGEYLGVHKSAGISYGSVKVNWVYNAMPPVAGQIYPPLALETVRKF